MSEQSRREFMATMSKGIGAACLLPIPAWAEGPCEVKHPIMPPNKDLSGQCPNCGMVRPMWARTWRTFENSTGRSQACSFHCMADMALKSGEEPQNVEVALYMNPTASVSARSAYFVVGSKAAGTMTMTSKLAFGAKSEADAFAKACGGKVMGFKDTLEMAKTGVQKENQMIVKRRLKKGKIVEPTDNKDKCPVCGMYPARHAKHKCQIQTKNRTVYHFCSTQCLFAFLNDTARFVGSKVEPFLFWVKDYQKGAWISGRSAYYVVGSSAQGPMGKEAIVFDKLADAKQFASQHGGKAVIFTGVTVDKIMA
jgi:copper chaperone NosL